MEIAEVAFRAGLVSCADRRDATAEDGGWPRRALRNRLAIHFACCVTSSNFQILLKVKIKLCTQLVANW